METFSSKNYFKPTPAKWLKFAIAMKGFIASISVGSFVSGNETLAFALLVIGALLNEAINFLSDDQQPTHE